MNTANALEGRRILVVGGGQHDYGLPHPPIGNGRAMSLLFAREGAAVAVADIDADGAETTAALVRDEGGSAGTGPATVRRCGPAGPESHERAQVPPGAARGRTAGKFAAAARSSP